MISSLFLSIAGMAAASPLAARSWPPISHARGFTLVANISDPSADLNPPVNHWTLAGVHSGAGLNAAVLVPSGGAVLFVNGTGRDVSAQGTSIALPPINVTGIGAVPMGLQFSPGNISEKDYTVSMGLDTGRGTIGAGIVGGLRSAVPMAFAPYSGSFVVCSEASPYPQHPVLFVRDHVIDDKGHVSTDIPAGCVAIRLLPQCAELPPLVGVDELPIIVEAADCYENVSSIDWSKY